MAGAELLNTIGQLGIANAMQGCGTRDDAHADRHAVAVAELIGKGLHRATIELVCAPKQAELSEKILPLLTEEEHAVFKRGRNANVHSIPHHASRAQYQQATALEALLGWLYLNGQRQRINELFNIMMEE